MEVNSKNCLIYVYAGRSSNGNPVHEELPAVSIGNNTYELLSSPGLALNLAKGDIVQISASDKPATIIRRGGNFCIQVYCSSPISNDVLIDFERKLQEELNGSLDGFKRNGSNDYALAITVPSRYQFNKIDNFFSEFKTESGINLNYYYGNIYKNDADPNDETLLDWWHGS